MRIDWQLVDFSSIDTPALVIDKDKVKDNINKAIAIAGGVERLRPHVKTHKMLEVAKMQIKAGIYKFKCATIAEAEMLGMAGAKDVLIAYPVQGPKIARVLKLINCFPDTNFSVLVDNYDSVNEIDQKCLNDNCIVDVYIDVNVGQNRTGIRVDKVEELIHHISHQKNILLKGLHCYDGHIHMASHEARESLCRSSLGPVLKLKEELQNENDISINLIAGGSPTFGIHAEYHNVECSPGTFVFWDENYGNWYPEQGFMKAAVLATRVISKIDPKTYCLDLGYKSVASESPLPRIAFLTDEEILQIGQSEEHLVIQCKREDSLKVGQVLLGYPNHICPTVALYEKVYVTNKGKINEQWDVIARNKKITI